MSTTRKTTAEMLDAIDGWSPEEIADTLETFHDTTAPIRARLSAAAEIGGGLALLGWSLDEVGAYVLDLESDPGVI